MCTSLPHPSSPFLPLTATLISLLSYSLSFFITFMSVCPLCIFSREYPSLETHSSQLKLMCFLLLFLLFSYVRCNAEWRLSLLFCLFMPFSHVLAVSQLPPQFWPNLVSLVSAMFPIVPALKNVLNVWIIILLTLSTCPRCTNYLMGLRVSLLTSTLNYLRTNAQFEVSLR